MDNFKKRLQKEKNINKNVEKEKELIKNIFKNYNNKTFKKDIKKIIRCVISDNKKTGASINMPINTCKPTKTCMKFCYACTGPISWKNSIRKSLLIKHLFNMASKYNLIKEVSEILVKQIYKKAPLINNKYYIRWNGSGDLTEDTVKVINYISMNYQNIHQYIFTRRPQMANKVSVNKHITINLSLDEKNLTGASKAIKVPHNKCYLHTTEDKTKIDINKIDVIFPVKKDEKNITETNKDCDCDRKKITTCIECKRCMVLKE